MPLIPSLIQLYWRAVSAREVALFSLPTRFGGRGIANCVNSATLTFQSSRQGSSVLVDAIIKHEEVCLTNHVAHLEMVHSDVSG